MSYDVSGAEAMIPAGRQYYREGNVAKLLGHTARLMAALREAPARQGTVLCLFI